MEVWKRRVREENEKYGIKMQGKIEREHEEDWNSRERGLKEDKKPREKGDLEDTYTNCNKGRR